MHIKDFVRENLWLQGKLAIKEWKTDGGGWRSTYSFAVCANAPEKTPLQIFIANDALTLS